MEKESEGAGSVHREAQAGARVEQDSMSLGGSETVPTSNGALDLHTTEMDLESLRLQIELQKLKLATAQTEAHNTGSTGGESRRRLSEYASELRAVLVPMPEVDPLVPAWFRNVDAQFIAIEVPESMQGSLILPFLTDRVRSFVAPLTTDHVLTYAEVKELVLRELKLTPCAYKRLLTTARKAENETWNQFATRVEILVGYYLNSRKIKTLEDLKQLWTSDKLKESMSEPLHTYVLQGENKQWLRPRDLVIAAENFEESHSDPAETRKWSAGPRREIDCYRRGTPEERRNACFKCGRVGHYRRECPLAREGTGGSAAGSPRLVAKVGFSVVGDGEQGAWVDIVLGGNPVRARIDSGADISVVRPGDLPARCRDEMGKVQLRGAFGSAVQAGLCYINAGLAGKEGHINPNCELLAAVTDKLTDEVGALLTPRDYQVLKGLAADTDQHTREVLDVEEAELVASATGSACADPYTVGAFAVEADSLSEDPEGTRTSQLIREQEDDVSLAVVWEQARNGTHGMLLDNGLLYHMEEINGKRQRQLVLPLARRKEVLQLAHDRPVGGHLSAKKTKARIRSAFFWPTLVTDVRKYCQSCHTCQIFARPRASDRVPITPLTRAERPFQTVYMDCIGPLEPKSTKGYSYALCVVDLCTRWAEVTPLRSLTARNTCQALLEMFARYGTPELICSDQGTNFISRLTAEFNERLGIRMRFSTPEHPESNGIVERFNGSFKKMLRHVIQENPRGWDRDVPCLLWAYRDVPHEITGFSPFELMYGRTGKGPLDILRKTWTGEWTPPIALNKSSVEYLRDIRRRMAAATKLAHERSVGAQKVYVDRYNLRARAKTFDVGDEVLVLDTRMGSKMKPRWQGPAKVLQQRRKDSYIVQHADGKEHWVHANRLRPYVVRVDQVSVVFDADDDFGEIVSVPSEAGTISEEEIRRQEASLTHEQNEELGQVLRKSAECFSDTPGRCTLGEHRIELLPNSNPSWQKPYKVPVTMREEVERQVRQLLEWDFIYPVESMFAHPIVCVAKKDGSVRMCVDYRQLNAITQPDRYPMEVVTELLYEVAAAHFISVLDMTRGYWQIAVHPDSQKFTTFAAPSGLYAWKVMPFGLRNAAATFQRVMNGMLRIHKGYAAAYIDDVAVYSTTWDEHLIHLTKVLDSIKEAGLKVNLKKCKFAQAKVKYLGHVIGSGGHSPDPIRTQALLELPAPRTKTELRRVLGMFNFYREYIPRFAEIVLPLTELTRKGVPPTLPWCPRANQAFETVKYALAMVSELAAPDLSGTLVLTTDASEVAVAACLAQGEAGSERPIAFLSKKLTRSQAKWAAVEREAYAIVWALGELETWVFGSKVKVQTDHNPLTYLTRTAPSSARLTRWVLALQKYDLEVHFIRGKDNATADTLSRAN